MIDRRNFLRTAAAVLGLLAGGKGRGEPVAGVDLAAGEDKMGVIVVNGMGLDDLGPEAIDALEDILHLYWDVDLLIEDESGVFPGLSHLITTGHCDDT